MTQYFRGEFYIFVDYVLGSNFYDSEEERKEVNDFLKLALLTIVTFIRKLTELQPIYREAQGNEEFWLVCPHHALAQSYKEIFDLLRKFFGGCNRSIRYYKPNNLQYNTLGPWVDHLINQVSDSPSITLID